MRTIGLLFLAALLCPTRAVGQSSPYRAQLEAAAKLRPASLSLPLDTRRGSTGDFAPERRFSSRAPGATLMIIGGAAIIAGAIAGGSGGTVLILGGVAVGAYGFYLYTR